MNCFTQGVITRSKHLVKEFKTVSDSEYEVPESLQHVMRSYQEFGYKWLRTVEHYQFGGILADDMGLGKTLQILSVLLAAKQEGRLDEALSSPLHRWCTTGKRNARNSRRSFRLY